MTVDIVREAAEEFTPARFKAKFAAIFASAELASEEDADRPDQE